MTIKNEVITNAIILKSSDYKENDSLVYMYSLEYGKMTLHARGVKKIKSKNSFGVQSITLSEITFIPKKGICTLIKAQPINYYRHIKEDIELEAYASFFIEYVLKSTQENEPNQEIYSSLVKALEHLNNGYNPKLVYLLYCSYILKNNGTPPVIDHCSCCDNTSNIKGISYINGGFVCVNCISPYDSVLTKDELKSFRHINKACLDDIDKIVIDDHIINHLIKIFDIFIDENTGIIFNTKKFIKQISI